MSYTSYWKGSSSKTQKPSKNDPSTGAINAPGTTLDDAWTLMPSADADGSSPPTYPDVRPEQALARSPANSVTGHPLDSDAPEVAIAIMGATGSGKSTFINLVSGSNLGIGRGLRSCTNAVQLAGAFDLDGRRVVLIDTPGFDDTTRSDTDVLKMIAAFLATSYEQGKTLAGVLYFHRISDFRMGGISTRNFKMFRKLCGDSTLKNVVIVTNMWGEVDPKVGGAREVELMREDIFFKPVLEKGAQMARHANTASSAENILRLVLDNHPLPLRIQRELVDEHMDIVDTSAGEELNRELNAQIKKHQEDMRALKEEMKQAMLDKDEETRRELEIETKRMQKEIERFENDAKRLASDYKSEKQRLEVRLSEMEQESKEEADRIARQYQLQIDSLKESLETNATASEREREMMLRQINELSRRRDQSHGGGLFGAGPFALIGAAIDGFIGGRRR